VKGVPCHYNKTGRLNLSIHRQVNVRVVGGSVFKSFYQMSSVFMVKNAVKLSAESEGVGIKDKQEI
jgi:hypothetical protein